MQLTEAARLGAALRRLRLRYDLSQAKAAELANTRQQTWQRYEAGANDAMLKVNLQRRLAEAIGGDHEEFLLELANLEAPAPVKRAHSGFGEHRRGPYEVPLGGHMRAGPLNVIYGADEEETIDLGGYFTEDVRVLRVAGESMVPYAEPGGFVTYHLKRYPRRGQGCVIEMKNGDFYVKRYEGVDEGVLIVSEIYPAERQIRFPLEEVKGYYAVGLRGD